MNLILLLARQWGEIVRINLDDVLMPYDLFFNLGLNTCRQNKHHFIEV